MFIKVDEDNNIIEFPYSYELLRRDNPSTAFPKMISDETMERYGCRRVIEDVPPKYDFMEYYAERDLTPKYIDSNWHIIYKIIERSEPDKLRLINNKKESLVGRRNQALTNCDWVIKRSMELGSEIPQEWREYRQTLRDLTNHHDFPDMEFPQPPQD